MSWLLCLVCLPGVSWLLCGSSLPCHIGLSAVCDCGISWSYSLFLKLPIELLGLCMQEFAVTHWVNLGQDFCYHKSYVCRIAVTYWVIGARFLLSYELCMQYCCWVIVARFLLSYELCMQDCCYTLSYCGQISVIIWVMHAFLLLSYCGQISVIIWVMHAGLLLRIELLWPDFCYHKSCVCRFFLPIGAYINPSSLISIIVCIEHKKMSPDLAYRHYLWSRCPQRQIVVSWNFIFLKAEGQF